MQSNQSPAGLIFPEEENGSYSSINHSFAEVFCYYWAFESNNGSINGVGNDKYDNGPQYASFFGNGIAAGSPDKAYRIDEGGNIQLLRIRIIQLLNEYYGPFKWVNDPFAKVKIICHSNGGLIATGMLKSDETQQDLWYNGGVNKKGQSWKDAFTKDYQIDGFGFILRDHVDQVITMGTPFAGSPLAKKDGSPNWLVVGAGAYAGGFAGYLTGLLPLLSPSSSAYLIPAGAIIGGYVTLDASFIESWDTPVMRDFAPGSNFMNTYPGNGSAPAYTGSFGSKHQIPYVNYVGTATEEAIAAAIGSGSAAAGSALLYFVGDVWDGTILASLSLALGGASYWAATTDIIVPVESQDMRSQFTNSSRERKNRDATHIPLLSRGITDVAGNEVPSVIDNPVRLKLLAGIGEGQILAPEDKVKGFPSTAVKTISKEGGHDILQLAGNDPTLPESKRWPVATGNRVTFSQTTGFPRGLLLHYQHYFMNKDLVEYKVNFADWKVAKPYTGYLGAGSKYDYGLINSAYLDWDRDGAITPGDLGSGTLLQLTDLTDSRGKNVLFEGSNLVQVRVSDPQTRTVKALYQVDLRYVIRGLTIYEADATGNQLTSGNLFYSATNWNAGSARDVYVVLKGPVREDASKMAVRVGQAGTLFMQGSCASLAPGQYCFEAVADQATSARHLLHMKVSYDQLAKGLDGKPDLLQVADIGFVLYDPSHPTDQNADGGGNAVLPFYVDNEAPTVSVHAPMLMGDYNADGVVDALDGCASTAEGYKGAECDGIDNNANGLIDGNDASEQKNLPYYSPVFDANGVLTTPSVEISFRGTDNSQALLPMGSSLKWRVYKVAGNLWSASDELVHEGSESARPVFEAFTTTSWGFERNRGVGALQDGLYAVVVEEMDAAGNVANSSPSYFVIDRVSPEIVVDQLSAAAKIVDDRDVPDRMNRESFSLRLDYHPVLDGANPFNSSARVVKANLQPVDATGVDLSGRSPLSFRSLSGYVGWAKDASGNWNSSSAGVGTVGGKLAVANATSITIANDEKFGMRGIEDGRYRVTLEATDAAGNNAGQNLNEIVTIDRKAPELFDQSVQPSLVTGTSFGFTAKITEKNDAESNRIGGRGSYAVDIVMDDPALLGDPTRTLYATSLPAQLDGVTELSILPSQWKLPLQQLSLSAGLHHLIVRVVDQNGNASINQVGFFHKNMGVGIVSPEAGAHVGGSVVLRGVIDDPDPDNGLAYDHHVLELLDETNQPIVGHVLTGSGLSNESNVVVRNGGVIGVVNTEGLPTGRITVRLSVFEKTASGTPAASPSTVLTLPLVVDANQALLAADPTLTATVSPTTIDDATTDVRCDYMLGNTVSDVSLEIRDARGDLVHEDRQNGMIPWAGEATIPMATGADGSVEWGVGIGRDPAGAGMKLMLRSGGLHVLLKGRSSGFSWSASDVSCATGVNCVIGINGSEIDISLAQVSSGSLEAMVSEAALARSGGVVVDVRKDGTSVEPELVNLGSPVAAGRERHPLAIPFILESSTAFHWNGRNDLGQTLRPGSYTARLRAVATRGSGYAETQPIALTVNTAATIGLQASASSTYSPGSQNEVLTYQFNGIGDLRVVINRLVGQDRVVVHSELLSGVAVPSGRTATWSWNGIFDQGGSASSQDRFEAVLSLELQGTGEVATATVPFGIQQESFANVPGEDVLEITGGRVGSVLQNGAQLPVVSGDIDAYLATKFEAGYSKPIRLKYSLTLLQAKAFELNLDFKWKTWMDFQDLVQLDFGECQQWRKGNLWNRGADIHIGDLLYDPASRWKFPNSFARWCGSGSTPTMCGSKPCVEETCLGKKYDGQAPWRLLPDHYAGITSGDPKPEFALPYQVARSDRYNTYPRFHLDFNDVFHRDDENGFGDHVGEFLSIAPKDAGIVRTELARGTNGWVEPHATVDVYGVGKLFSYLTFVRDNPTASVVNDAVGAEVMPDQVPWNLLGADGSLPGAPIVKSIGIVNLTLRDSGGIATGGTRPGYSTLDAFVENRGTAAIAELRPSIDFASSRAPQCTRFRWSYNLVEKGQDLAITPILKDNNGVTYVLSTQFLRITKPASAGEETPDLQSAPTTLEWSLDGLAQGLTGQHRLVMITHVGTVPMQPDFYLIGPDPGGETKVVSGDIQDAMSLDRSTGTYAPLSLQVSDPGSTQYTSYRLDVWAQADDGSWVPAPVKAQNGGSPLQWTLAFDPKAANAGLFQSNWDPMGDPVLAQHGGVLLDTLHAPDKFNSWNERTYRDAYERQYQEWRKTHPAPLDNTGFLFLNGGGINPNLALRTIATKVTAADGSGAFDGVSDQTVKYNMGEDYTLASFALRLKDDPGFSMVRLKRNAQIEPQATTFSIHVKDGGSLVPVVENQPIKGAAELVWNAKKSSGPLDFRVTYDRPDGTTATYQQLGYLGEVIGEQAYAGNADMANYASVAPFRMVELQYKSQTPHSFESDPILAAVRKVKLSELPLRGIVPHQNLSANAPAFTVLPAPYSWPSADRRPLLTYRLFRSQVVGQDGRLLINEAEMPRIYSIDRISGALKDVSTGDISAYRFGSGLSALCTKGTTDPTSSCLAGSEFFARLPTDASWDYLELTAIPEGTGDLTALDPSRTLRDAVVLDPGHDFDAATLPVSGLYRKGGNDYATDGVKLLVNFNPDMSASTYDGAVLNPAAGLPNLTITIPRSSATIGADGRFKVDLSIPAGLAEGQIVRVFAIPYRTGLDEGQYNASVGYAQYRYGRLLPLEVRTLQGSIDATHDEAVYSITARNAGVVTATLSKPDGTPDKYVTWALGAGETVTLRIPGTFDDGSLKTEGIYPLTFSLRDHQGRQIVSQDVSSYLVDRTPPEVSSLTAVMIDSRNLVFRIDADLADGMLLAGSTLEVVASNASGSTVLLSKAYSLSALTTHLSENVTIDPAQNVLKLSIRVGVVDAAGNRTTKEIEVPAYQTFDLEIQMKDNGVSDPSLSRPQLYVRNRSADALEGMTLRMWVSKKEQPSQTIEVDKYYDAIGGIQYSAVPSSVDPDVYVLDFRYPGSYVLAGGQQTDPNGFQFGVHFNNYYPGVWDRSNDYSFQGIGADFKSTDRVCVYDKHGRIVFGTEPALVTVPPVDPPTNPPTGDPILGMESVSSWTSTAALSRDEQMKTEGSASLSIQGSGYITLRSSSIATSSLRTGGSKLAVDLYIPSAQPNFSWLGALALYIDCPSAGINHLYVGQNELTGSATGKFTTFQIALPQSVLDAISQDRSDFTIEYALNVNQTGEPWRMDNVHVVK